MPGVNDFNGNWLQHQLARMMVDIRALQTQQQQSITNAVLQPVLNFGLVPGSNPATYGLQFMNPTNNTQAMFVGEDGAGNAYMAFYNASGQKLSQFDQTGIHLYNSSGVEIVTINQTGFHVNNASGQEEARLGQLSSSPAIYGVGVAPATGSAPGTLQQVGGALTIVNTTGLSSISTSQAIPSTSVTAEIGPSQSALITVGAQITMSSGTGSSCNVIVRLDGANNGWGGVWGFGLGSGSNPNTSGSYTAIMGPSTGTAITAGQHTFDCYAVLAGTATCTISDVTLNVQPL
jgi:hypothetical protein